MAIDLPHEQVGGVLDQIAEAILADAACVGPPVDAFAVARKLGMLVVRGAAGDVRAQFLRVGGQSVANRPTVLLAPDPRPERRQWAVAHEIGEAQAESVIDHLQVGAMCIAPSWRERIANQLAGRILLPRAWFAAAGVDCQWDLLALKEIFSTASHELLARRMLEMNPHVVITLFDHGQPVWRKANRQAPAPRLSDPERAAQQLAYRSACAQRAPDETLPTGVADIRAWPLHEPGWRREIVRTEIAEWY